jgi:hypothetical protein
MPIPDGPGRTPTSWRVIWFNVTAVEDTIHVFAVCAPPRRSPPIDQSAEEDSNRTVLRETREVWRAAYEREPAKVAELV